MIERGTGGKIINMASARRAAAANRWSLVYCATKAAVISITQSAGLNLIEHGINVNAISPGVVDGEHWDGVDAFFARFENKAPGQKKTRGRRGRALRDGWARRRILTGMAVFLASGRVGLCRGPDATTWTVANG